MSEKPLAPASDKEVCLVRATHQPGSNVPGYVFVHGRLLKSVALERFVMEQGRPTVEIVLRVAAQDVEVMDFAALVARREQQSRDHAAAAAFQQRAENPEPPIDEEPRDYSFSGDECGCASCGCANI